MLVAENDGQQGQGDTTNGTEESQATGEMPTEGAEGQQGDTTNDDEQVIVTIGEEAPPSEEDDQPAPNWVKELRKTNRELARENRELRQKQQAEQTSQPAAPAMPKPTLAACDYDEDVFESKLAAWHEQQAQVKAEQQKKQDAEKAATDAWNAKLAAYGKAKDELKVRDFDDAEEVVKELFNVTQQSLLIKCPSDSEKLIYALGTNRATAQKLASIVDPVDFVYAVAELRNKLKIQPRKAPPPPETTVRGSAPVAPGGSGATLARLEAEADRTRDRSKVAAYRRQLKAKQA